MGMACSDGRRHPRMDDWAGLGRRRARSMAYWLEGLEILGCFHCSANDHAPKGDVDLKCKQHLNSPVSSDFKLADVVSSEDKAAS